MSSSVPAPTLAGLFKCEEKTIRELARKGIVVRSGRGEYILGQSIQNYVEHLRKQAAGRLGRDEDVDPAKENGLFKREQREHYRLKNAIISGNYVAMDQIEPAWAIVMRAVRSGMLAVPSKIRMRLPHLTNHDGEVIDQIIREQLEDAAATDVPPLTGESFKVAIP